MIELKKSSIIMSWLLYAACCSALLSINPDPGNADTQHDSHCNESTVNNLSVFCQKTDPAGISDSHDRAFPGKLFHDLGYAAKTTASDFKYIYTSPLRINSRYALWLGGIIVAGGILFAYDQDIYDTLQRNKEHKLYRPILDTGEFFEPAGYMGDANKFIFGTLAVGYITGYKPLINISADLLESYAVAISGKLVKTFAGRNGPGDKKGPRFFKYNDGASFPSGHSMNIMQMANILSHHIDYLPFQIAAYGAASSVFLQRITSDHHWPSDVYSGAVFGWVISHELLKLKTIRKMNITPVAYNNGTGLEFILTYKF